MQSRDLELERAGDYPIHHLRLFLELLNWGIVEGALVAANAVSVDGDATAAAAVQDALLTASE